MPAEEVTRAVWPPAEMLVAGKYRLPAEHHHLYSGLALYAGILCLPQIIMLKYRQHRYNCPC